MSDYQRAVDGHIKMMQAQLESLAAADAVYEARRRVDEATVATLQLILLRLDRIEDAIKDLSA